MCDIGRLALCLEGRGRVEGGKAAQEGRDVCTCDSLALFCPASETNAALQSSYPPIKKF